MSDLDARVGQLEIDSLKRELDQLSKDVKDLEPKTGFLELVRTFSPLATPVIVALIGLYATISITGVLEKQRLELSQLTAIRQLLIDLAAPGADPAAAQASAVALAAFGPPAIVPLVHELQAEGQARPMAAADGLRTLAFQHHTEVCGTLSQVLQDRSRLFTWITHKRVIELLGDIDCTDAGPVLSDYLAMFEAGDALERYRPRVREVPEPDKKSVHKLRKSVKDAIESLER